MPTDPLSDQAGIAVEDSSVPLSETIVLAPAADHDDAVKLL
jgi:hypothetical protein